MAGNLESWAESVWATREDSDCSFLFFTIPSSFKYFVRQRTRQGSLLMVGANFLSFRRSKIAWPSNAMKSASPRWFSRICLQGPGNS